MQPLTRACVFDFHTLQYHSTEAMDLLKDHLRMELKAEWTDPPPCPAPAEPPGDSDHSDVEEAPAEIAKVAPAESSSVATPAKTCLVLQQLSELRMCT